MYCEDPNFVISVAYKIQFGSKVNESLLELDTSSSVTTRYQGAYHGYFSVKLYHPQLHHLQKTPFGILSLSQEAIAAKYISFHWKDGKSNPADILSKHWEFATVWPMLKPILFWRGETATQLKGSDRIPSTNPGAEPPGDARDSGSARSHTTHLETSSSDRP